MRIPGNSQIRKTLRLYSAASKNHVREMRTRFEFFQSVFTVVALLNSGCNSLTWVSNHFLIQHSYGSECGLEKFESCANLPNV